MPGAPSGLNPRFMDGQFALSWTGPASDGGSYITGYQYRQDSGSWTSIPSSQPGQANSINRYTVSGLTNGTTYDFQVRAVNAQGESPPSDGITVALSPSGTQIAYTDTTGNLAMKTAGWGKHLDSSVAEFAWSPVSTHLAFLTTDGYLYVVTVALEPVWSRIRDVVATFSWSSDPSLAGVSCFAWSEGVR
ncbi:MAG: fibronectin type III domain-containing protein, partial [bacterium]|nr:fibronectin type III domain-containing protein [bacterium]